MPAATLSESDRAAIIAFAALHGPAAAAREFPPHKVGTIRAWLSRHGKHLAPDSGNPPPMGVTQGATLRKGSGVTPVTLRRAVTEDETEDTEETGDTKDEGGILSHPTERPARRRKASHERSDDYIDGLKSVCERMLGYVSRMKLNPSAVHRVASAVEKLERAGRVPFGYGGAPVLAASAGGNTLVNIAVHTGPTNRGDDLPSAIRGGTSDDLPVSLEIQTESPTSEEGAS